jgi:hypothetical protein
MKSSVMQVVDLVSLTLEAMRASSLGPSQAARETIEAHWHSIDAALQQELAIIGLGSRVAASYANRRLMPQPTAEEKALVTRATESMARAVGKAVVDHTTRMLRSISLYTRGRMRTLFDFTLADLESWSRKSRSRSAAWEARAEWCRIAIHALAHSQAKTIGRLPQPLRSALATSARQTWVHPIRLPKGKRRAA